VFKFLRGGHLAPVLFSPGFQHGFSLVELMVVVGIVALLSSVAIPNFMQFQAKSRTTEAKLQLAGIYTAEAAFFGSYSIYHNCINYMDYDPTEFRNSRYYSVGITVDAAIHPLAFLAAVNSDLDPTACPQNMPSAEGLSYFPAGTGVGGIVADVSFIPPTSVGDQSGAGQVFFVAGAGGVIHKRFLSSATASAFTIDQRKKISTIRNGF
jgi:type IV pilus assembly protein PilA